MKTGLKKKTSGMAVSGEVCAKADVNLNKCKKFYTNTHFRQLTINLKIQ